MLFQKEYRDKDKVLKLTQYIKDNAKDLNLKIMHVCGTHENTVMRFGLRELLPENIEIIAGPGCPVCVCPAADIDFAINLSKEEDTIVTCFGDMIRVPGTKQTLEEVKAKGANVEIVTNFRLIN